MATHQLAQGLASFGRNGDSVMVHMQPEEVAGLQALAQANGTTLTVNPHTGMPEAFNLGGFLSSLLPTIAGGAASMIPGMQPFGLSALQSGILAGALTGAVTKKKDPLMGALMGGLGGFGGANIANSVANFGANAANTAADAAAVNLSPVTDFAANGMTEQPYQAFMDASGMPAAPNMGFNAPVPVSDAFNLATPQNAEYMQSLSQSPITLGQSATTQAAMSPVDQFQAGLDRAMESPDAFIGQVGAAKLALPLGGAMLAGMEEEGTELPEELRKKKSGPLNLNYDTGLRLADGGTVSTGGLMNLYNANDAQYGPQISQNGYGIGRLNTLATEAANARAQQGYAEGGVPTLEEGGFVVPADVVSHMGNGDTNSGLAFLQNKYGAHPIQGRGDGMSDDIPTTIEGRHPALVASGEAYIPRQVVNRHGGTDKFYNMMDKIRKARTGTTKQGRQINPDRYA